MDSIFVDAAAAAAAPLGDMRLSVIGYVNMVVLLT